VRPPPVRIDPTVLRRWYVDEGLSAEEIARRLGCGPTTVLRRLRAAGIAARNLSRHRGLSITSKDRDLLETVKDRLGLSQALGVCRNGQGRSYSTLHWRDRALYTWLTDLGLTPAKSLTLGPLAVPDEYFRDFLRGCIDGDGSIVVYTDRYHTAKNARYVYETALRVGRVGEPPVRRLAARHDTEAPRRAGQRPRAALDLLPARAAVPAAEARESGTVSFGPR
jgi:transposase